MDSQPAKSKRQFLKLLPDGWRSKIVDRAQFSDTYADALSVLKNTGCRPAELARGVEVFLDNNHAIFRIMGKKVTGSAGQVWREIPVRAAALAPSLLRAVQDREHVIVQIWSTAGLRSALLKWGAALWPKGPRVVPYLFRHALTEDLREGGWSAEEIGAVLGHRVSETSAQYGRKRRPGQGRGSVEPVNIIRGGVQTAVPVRPLKIFDSTEFSARITDRSAIRTPR